MTPVWVDYLVAFSTLGGVVVGAVGVYLALMALWEIKKERRIVFELELLRDLAPYASSYNQADTPQVWTMLACLPTNELPLWRLCEQAGHRRENIVEALWAELKRTEQPRDPDRDRWATLALSDEIQQAIRKRIR